MMFCLATLVACGEEDAAPGDEGGSCLIGSNACVEGLVCQNGICAVGSEEEPPIELEVDFSLEANRLAADGMSKLIVEMNVIESDSGENFNGDLLVYPNPSTVGRVVPGQVTFEDGFGFFEYVACNRAVDLECPSYVTINVARIENPLVPIARTEEIRLDDPVTDPEGQ